LIPRLQKICGVHAGVPLSGALFILRGGGTNKKTHFKSLSWTLRKTLHDPSQAEMQLVKIENLYRNYFTQVLLTGAEPFRDSFVLRRSQAVF